MQDGGAVAEVSASESLGESHFGVSLVEVAEEGHGSGHDGGVDGAGRILTVEHVTVEGVAGAYTVELEFEDALGTVALREDLVIGGVDGDAHGAHRIEDKREGLLAARVVLEHVLEVELAVVLALEAVDDDVAVLDALLEALGHHLFGVLRNVGFAGSVLLLINIIIEACAPEVHVGKEC